MRGLVKLLLPFALLITCTTSAWSAAGRIPSVEGDVRGSFTGIAVDGVVVNVEAMIGEATLVQENVAGEKDVIVVTTGTATQKDPSTGKILLAPATVPNPVNEVVHAIAAAAPDASTRLPNDEGCSLGKDPQRLVPQPDYDEATAAVIESELKQLSPGDLMMVIAVLINNANHLCIDATTVADTVSLIATVRPEEAANMAFVASLLDPEHADRYTNAATSPRPTHKPESQPPQVKPKAPIEPERDIPPGGAIGEPPSPE